MRSKTPAGPALPRAPISQDMDPMLVNYMAALNRAITQELNRRLVKDEATSYFHLISPIGKVFKVTVDDAGVLTTELVGE